MGKQFKKYVDNVVNNTSMDKDDLINKLDISKTYFNDLYKRGYTPKKKGSKGVKVRESVKKLSEGATSDEYKFTGNFIDGKPVVEDIDTGLEYLSDNLDGDIKDLDKTPYVEKITYEDKHGNKQTRYKATKRHPTAKNGRFIGSDKGEEMFKAYNLRKSVKMWRQYKDVPISRKKALKEIREYLTTEKSLRRKVQTDPTYEWEDYEDDTSQIKRKKYYLRGYGLEI